MKRLIRFVLNRVPRSTIQRVAHLATPVMRLLYAGRGVECPVCGGRYRRMMPYGYGPVRSNALCPGCLSLERHRLLWLWLIGQSDFFVSAPHTLHVAPERCFIGRFERALGESYVTADLESPLARVRMDVQAIPFPDETFDVVICNHILEHVEDDRLAMREMHRVMRTGGWGVMLSPVNPERATTHEDASITTPEGRSAAFGQHDHLRDYGRDYPDRLREAGFRVKEIDYCDALTTEQIARFALRRETLYIVEK
ncbi:SAM-dependent methyltransferase [Bacteroidia bacterium]|nr:SAM-dependent methyltransferase [Bacteroidia bacterium]